MHKWFAFLLLGCVARVKSAPPAETRAPACTMYRLNLADEAEDVMPCTRQEDASAWMLRPEEPVDAQWFARMAALGYRSFDLSSLEKVPWLSLPEETERLSLVSHALEPRLLALKALRYLDLSLTNAGDGACEALLQLDQLQKLALFRTEIGDACLVSLAKLPRLERLDLGKTHVTDAGVVKLVGLRMLSALVLSHTQVTEKSVAVLLDHFALQRLDVNETAVKGGHIARSTSLERLDLGQSKVGPKIIRTLLRHPYLKWLSLSGLGIEDKNLADIGGLTRLEVLDLSGTHVTDLAALATLEHLVMLAVAQTFVSDLAPLAPRLPGLRYLDISATAVQQLAPLEAAVNLRSLYAASVQGTNMQVIGKLTELRALDLNDTPTDDATAQLLSEQLRILHLRHTHLTAVGLAALGRLRLLETLDVSAAPLDRAQLLAWRFEHLRVLNASFTHLRQLRGSGLPKSIERLYLLGVDIPESELPTKSDLPRLKQLQIGATASSR